MRHSSLTWTDEQKKNLLEAMEKRKGSISAVAKKFAKQLGTTQGAVHAKYNTLRRSGMPASTARVPDSATTPTNLFNSNIRKIEEITGYTFAPSEIVEISDLVKH